MAASGGDVMESGLAYIHAGERITPASVVSSSSTSTSSVDSGVHFHNCTFTGVTQDLVNDVMDKAVKTVRRIGGF